VNAIFERSLRFAPKLTRTHFCPGPFDKLKVQLAAQLFSHSVAVGMEAEMALNILPQSANATIEFISNINNLTGHIVDEMSYKAIFSGTGKQIELIDLVTVHASGADVTKRIKSLWCWKITINSLVSIHNFLNKPLIIIRRFNQNIIEHFFGAIRKQSGNCYNPTRIQFKRAFKKCCLRYFQHNPAGNCAADLASVLSTIEDFSNINESRQLHNIIKFHKPLYQPVAIDST
jgi:hypothetical protein